MTRCETVVRIGTQAMTSIIEYGGSVKNNLRPAPEKRLLIAYAMGPVKQKKKKKKKKKKKA